MKHTANTKTHNFAPCDLHAHSSWCAVTRDAHLHTSVHAVY